MQEPAALQIRIGREIEEAVLPYYRSLFPPSPRVYEEGGYRILHNPFYGIFNGARLDYETYVARVREGCLPARSIHGPIHAVRVALWAGLLTVLSERYTGVRTTWLFEIQMAAAFHDAGRQDEGSDEWEHESEKIFIHWLSNTPDASVEAQDILQHDRVEKRTLIDADTLDIQRVLGAGTAFDATRLSFWNDDRIPQRVKQDLIDETRTLIHITEAPELKRELEDSGAVYFHLMHVLVQAHRTRSSLPLLYDLLHELAGEDPSRSDSG